ncbi:MAG: PQQ-binding-like beta-propeller repeat protein [Dehalococcoidia bacterium]
MIRLAAVLGIVLVFNACTQDDPSNQESRGDDAGPDISTARVLALDPRTGAENWRHVTSSTQIGAVGGSAEVAIIGTEQEVLALDPASGQERWRFPITVNGFRYERPEVFEDTVVAGTNEGDGAWVALDAATGAERWRIPEGRRFGFVIERAGDLLVAEAGNPNDLTYRLVALRVADGREVWSVDLGRPKTSVWTAASETTVFATGWTDELRALDAATGQLLWSAPFQSFPQSLAYLHDMLVVTATELRHPDEYTTVVALDPTTARELWRIEWKGSGPLPTSEHPASNGDSLFLFTGEREVSSIDPATGKIRWSAPTSVPSHAVALAANQHSLFLTTGTSVVALNTSDGTEQWRERVSAYGTHIIPTAYEDRLLVSVGGKAPPHRD